MRVMCSFMGCGADPVNGKTHCKSHLVAVEMSELAIKEDFYKTFMVLGDFPEGSFVVRMAKKGDPWWLIHMHINAMVHSMALRKRVHWEAMGEMPNATGVRLWHTKQLRRFDWDNEQRCLVEVPHEGQDTRDQKTDGE